MKWISILALILGLIAISFSYNQPKFAHVNVGKLVYDYQGMKTGHKEFEKTKIEMQTKIENMESTFKLSVQAYETSKANVSEKERMNQERFLVAEGQKIAKAKEEISKKLQLEDQTITEGVLNQINSFLKIYGKENGYSMIFGSNGNGGLLYAEESEDITETVLIKLNEEYNK